jgi:hypothetical protein
LCYTWTCGYIHQEIIQWAFPLIGQNFVQEILLVVFRKTDFETKSATPDYEVFTNLLLDGVN